MRAGSYFINTARGEVVDQQALVNAIRNRGIRAGLDVYALEPTSATGEFQDEIAKEAALYGTHHIGASTDQAQEQSQRKLCASSKSSSRRGKFPTL